MFVSYPGIVPCSGIVNYRLVECLLNKSVTKTKVCSVVGSHHLYSVIRYL